MANRLARTSSPYLLQHAENPVDWQPWGPEALQQARREEKPIFLSIGYSACHWCHVMAHESFENPEIARLLNQHFVSIKVDREERPDLDQIYMEAVQLMTGQGGWPMSMFLTPEQEPFFGGTYWPLPARGGMPGFDQVLRAIADAWKNRRDELYAQARKVTEAVRENQLSSVAMPGPLTEQPLFAAEAALGRSFDPHFGGFGAAPKFPAPLALRLLLRRWRQSGKTTLLDMVAATLDRMAAGGIYDQLGGGFHRYSVDDRWLVPHFEKMLYDNALLAVAYLEAWQATGEADYARVVRETLDYVLRDMTDPGGGFYSAEDADSEGHEGKFYLWTPEEVRSVLGPEAAEPFCYVYDVTGPGNFEDRNTLNRPKTIGQCAAILGRDAAELEAELAESRRKLLAARGHRIRPGRDDKVLVNWNGLMIEALALAGAGLGEPRYSQAAVAATEFLLQNARDRRGRLLHAWRGGVAQFPAYLEDYAALANALTTLHETDGQRRWLDAATAMADAILARFADRNQGGFFYTADDHEPLVVRRKDVIDSPVPSGNGLAVTVLLRLGRRLDRDDYLTAAEQTLRLCGSVMEQMPTATGQLLLALDLALRPAS